MQCHSVSESLSVMQESQVLAGGVDPPSVLSPLFDTFGLGTRPRMAPNQVRFELASAVLTAENSIAGD